MVLLALHEGYKDLNFYGVHMAHDTEYYYQQPSCAWALGMAQAMGCTIFIPKDSELLKARFEYGFGEPTEAMKRIDKRINALTKGLQNGRNQIDTVKEAVLKTEGALSEARYWHGYFSGTR